MVEHPDEIAVGRHPLWRSSGSVKLVNTIEIERIHAFDLMVGAGQSLCLIGPNGAVKSTILHSICGFTDIPSGAIRIRGEDVTQLGPNEKLKARASPIFFKTTPSSPT